MATNKPRADTHQRSVGTDSGEEFARSVHDGLGQYVSLSRMLVEQITSAFEETGGRLGELDGQRLRYALSLLRDSEREIGHLLGIRASYAWQGLFHSIEDYAGAIQESLHVKCALVCRGNDQEVSREISYNAQMIVREAVQNAVRHGRASEIEIAAVVQNSRLEIQVTDNGVGFEANLVKSVGGIQNMQMRIRRLGGSIEISSRPQIETKVIATFPLDSKAV